MNKIIVITIAGALSAIAAGCSAAPSGNNTGPGGTGPAGNANSVAANTAPAKAADETPAQIKAAFPDAQSFTTQHKDIPKDKITDIEDEVDDKVPGVDHHSYLAFSTAGGSRKQIGAATIVEAAGKDVVIVYENKDGSPVIKVIRVDGVPAPFLAQFVGKGHDNQIWFGTDIKANGADEATAKAITKAIKIDVLTMQALYGAAHSH
jgi:uncharacterized protein involved in copper resistance